MIMIFLLLSGQLQQRGCGSVKAMTVVSQHVLANCSFAASRPVESTFTSSQVNEQWLLGAVENQIIMY